MVKSVDAKAGPPRVKSHFCHVLAVWPWVGHLTFLCLFLLIFGEGCPYLSRSCEG